MVDILETIRAIVATGGYVMFLYMVYLSGFDGYDFPVRTQVLVVVVIIIMSHGPEALEGLIRAYRGDGVFPPLPEERDNDH